MSGGRAFVLDINPAHVNMDMVDVLAVPSDQSEELRAIITNFALQTDSMIATQLLDDWKNSLRRISLVMPRDYARVLEAMARATREGLPADAHVMEVAAHG
jgi:glutamate synthase (NADPH/NADH) large chain